MSDDDYIRLSKAAVTQVTAIFSAAGDDCDKLTRDLKAYASNHEAAISAITGYERAHPEAMKKFDAASTKEGQAYRSVSYPAVFKCRAHPELLDAVRKAGGA